MCCGHEMDEASSGSGNVCIHHTSARGADSPPIPRHRRISCAEHVFNTEGWCCPKPKGLSRKLYIRMPKTPTKFSWGFPQPAIVGGFLHHGSWKNSAPSALATARSAPAIEPGYGFCIRDGPLLLMIEILHGPVCQNSGNYGSIVCIWSCSTVTIILGTWELSQEEGRQSNLGNLYLSLAFRKSY